ncbi:hypothetical protein [Sphingomonas parapaucimobilis]|uniref:hypothetical protein n=1 Tax=Sphingomonas parapaucimobilis TaxID=28213 RepID=UPI0039194587
MIFSHRFRMMAQEGHLASNALLTGLEGLAKSDHYQPGTIYTLLFNLSIGLERLMKIIFVTHHMANNDLNAPSNTTLQNKFRHSLTKIYDHLQAIGKDAGVNEGWYEEGSLHYDVLTFMSEFAAYSRYHNLDLIAKGTGGSDPLIEWYKLHLRIAEDSLSYRRRISINEQAIAHCDRSNMYGYTMGMRGEYELMVDIVYQLELTKRTRGHCVWTILQIIKPLYRLLCWACSQSHEIEITKGLQEPVVPHLDEMFPFGLTTREDAIRRKAWTTLFCMGGRY